MADMKLADPNNYPLEPRMTLEMSSTPAHSNFNRYLTFEDHTGSRKRLNMSFRKTSTNIWEIDSFPDGIAVLKSLVDPENRSYWDKIYLENRGGDTTLAIKHLKLTMRYKDPAGSSPAGINHAEIPMVDWAINMTMLAGNDEISLNEFSKRSLHKWAGLLDSDPPVVRMAVEDIGKSGSDGSDQYGLNPKYGGAISLLCTEFVTWYYYQNNIKVNNTSVRDLMGAQAFHDLFEAAGKLYRYNSGVNLKSFVHSVTGEKYIPQPGDYLERRGPDGAEHSMIMFRWIPGNPSASNENDRYNQAIVLNGPWPVTLRLVRIHQDEINEGKDFWVGRIS